MNEYMTRFMPIKVLKYEKSALFDLVKLDSLPIVGIGNITNKIDLQWDLIQSGAFKKSIERFKKTNSFPKMFKEHNKNHVCGEWSKVEEDSFGLKLNGIVTDKELIKNILNHTISGLSVGFSIAEDAYEYKREYVFNSRKGIHEYKWIRVIKECDLVEVSLVEYPANEHSRFHIETVGVNDDRELG